MRPTPDNIIFIGMPGSGKSTLGVLYAKAEMYSFCDTDLFVQREEKLPLFKIIEKKGLSGFLETESKVVSSIKGLHRTVIATGGSVVYGEDAMNHLKSIGTVVFLDVALDELEKRVQNLATRGIMFRSGETLADIYDERLPLYKKYADVTVECSADGLAENAAKIAAALNL